MRNLDVVFAFFFSIMLHEKVYLSSALGATLIVVFAIATGLEKSYEKN
jgi:uncharacterized membrane protein